MAETERRVRRVQAEFHTIQFAGCEVPASVTLADHSAITGLIQIRPEVSISTGVYMGPVSVEIARCAEQPERIEAGWKDIVELSVVVGSEPLLLSGPWELPDIDNRLDSGPGLYQLRISSRGRDTAYDDVVEEPVEEYLVQAWPTSHPVFLSVACASQFCISSMQNFKPELALNTGGAQANDYPVILDPRVLRDQSGPESDTDAP